MRKGRIRWLGVATLWLTAVPAVAADGLAQPLGGQAPGGASASEGAADAPNPDPGALPFSQPVAPAKPVAGALAAPGVPRDEPAYARPPGGDAGFAPEAQPAQGGPLVTGDAYTFDVKRGDVTRTFGGNLIKVTDKWIVLRRMAKGQNDYGVPGLASLPKVGGMFRRSYESLIEDDLWIPREAATIASHHHVATATAMKPVLGSEPPTRSRCDVAYAKGEKFGRREGDLTTVTDDKVTLMTVGPFRTQYPVQVLHREILCVSIPVVISNVRMTERDTTQDGTRK